MVVCTHLEKNTDKQLTTVTETFWPGDTLNTNRVIPYSLRGLSAINLLDLSNTTKTPLEVICTKRSLAYRVLDISNTTKPPLKLIYNKRSLAHHVRVPLFLMVYAD